SVRAAFTTAACSASRSGIGKEGEAGLAHDGDDERPVEEPVAALAARLGQEEAGVTGRGVQRLLLAAGHVRRTERIGAAEPQPLERPREEPLELVRLAEAHEPAERP